MGTFINIGNAGFRRIRNSEYVDKSGLIAVVNSTLFTERCFSCVTRCRRFGKSMAAKMLCAYYDHSVDSRNLFTDLEIAKDPSFDEHLNKYPVISLDMTYFVTRFHDDDIVGKIDAALREDVMDAYPQVETRESDDLMDCLVRIAATTGEQFIFIIDEWDAICREFKPGTTAMDRYVNWLRRMFKSLNAANVFAGVYMTGILPVKKYKTESALNNFIEYSMDLIPCVIVVSRQIDVGLNGVNYYTGTVFVHKNRIIQIKCIRQRVLLKLILGSQDTHVHLFDFQLSVRIG